MTYRGFTFILSGVYKVERGKQLKSLIIFNKYGNTVYKSDFIYEDEKTAFKDAKYMIRTGSFEPVVRKHDGFNISGLHVVCNILLKALCVVMVLSLVAVCIGSFSLPRDLMAFGFVYGLLGAMFTVMFAYWGIFAKGGINLSGRKRKLYNILWWLSTLFNKSSANMNYDRIPAEQGKKGWYSSTLLVCLIFETLSGVFVLVGCTEFGYIGLMFCSSIVYYIVLWLCYILSIVWEICDSYINEGVFPFGRVLIPFLAVVVMFVFVAMFMRMFGVY